MPGPWDSAAKRLLREMPQHIVSWLLGDALFVRTLPAELKSRNIFADGLYAVTEYGQPALMHIEFQSRTHRVVPDRLLEYNVLASSENELLPVHTFVIYLRDDGQVPESPLIRRFNNGQEYHRFHYTVVEVARIPARSILRSGLHGLYPLILLADGGLAPDIVQEMVTTLTEEREIELLALAYTFGGLAPSSEAYESWFRRSFAMLDDILEESWTYQEIVKKGMQKGIQQGIQQGIQEGEERERQRWIQAQHEVIVNLVQRLFPKLVTFTQPRVEAINDVDTLHTLLNQLVAAQTVEEVKQAIMQARAEE